MLDASKRVDVPLIEGAEEAESESSCALSNFYSCVPKLFENTMHCRDDAMDKLSTEFESSRFSKKSSLEFGTITEKDRQIAELMEEMGSVVAIKDKQIAMLHLANRYLKNRYAKKNSQYENCLEGYIAAQKKLKKVQESMDFIKEHYPRMHLALQPFMQTDKEENKSGEK